MSWSVTRTSFIPSSLLLVSTAVFPGTPCNAQISLTEDAAGVGLVAVHAPAELGYPGNQYNSAGGMAVGDFNRDGHQDLFWLSGGLAADKLFINQGDGTFTDEAAAWGLTDLHTGCGAAVGDYNNDSWPDIYVTSFGAPSDTGGAVGKNRLYMNNGGTSFTEVAEAAGVNYTSYTASNGFGCVWGDYDLDGDLDLAVACWRSASQESDGNRLYENNGDGTFTDVTATALGPSIIDTRGYQPAFIDMDGDLYPDLIWVADYNSGLYFVNNGDGTFSDETAGSGTGLDEAGMGLAIGDFDNNGLFDFYVSSIYWDELPHAGYDRGNMLYMGLGDHEFSEEAEARGADDGGWSWGASTFDLDNDSWQDIISVNGWDHEFFKEEFVNERAKLWHNDGSGSFTDIADEAGLTHDDLGICVVTIDTNSDGRQDVLIASTRSALQCYENNTDGGNYLRLFFDTDTNSLLAPDGFHTRTETTIGKQTLHHMMHSSPSYLGTGELSIHIGLGDAETVDELRITWARGQVTVLENVAANQTLTVVAPTLGDINTSGSDGIINVADLLAMLGFWGPVTSAQALAADLNNDGAVSVSDLLHLLGLWGS
jgi:hypothetical protein